MTAWDDAPPTGDAEARRQIRSRLDETLFVEAGAGTGKTTALVGRIVELVVTGTARLRAIAAITFTEAAAAELRDRVREQLELVAAGLGDDELTDPAMSPETRQARRSRATDALAELDAAAIGTLHGFAQRILAEHPFEAGLPPTFEVFDQIRSQVAFDERWGAFLDRLLDDPAARPSLSRALVCGIGLGHLRSVALELNRNWDLVADHPLTAPAPAPIDVTEVLAGLDRAAAHLARCRDADDRLAVHIRSLAGYARRLAGADSDLDRLQLLAQAPPLARRYGQKANWDDCVDEARQALGDAQAARDATLQAVTRQALGELLVALRQLTLQAADERRREGSLEFHDLLVQARQLLRSRPEVAAHLHTTYTHLLIDEFQDTDPIQIELAVRIATDDPEAGTRDWSDLSVPAGRLFLVGDPKQAIYRFRRADIGLFLAVRDALSGPVLRLSRNHRSVPGVLDWVNATFGSLLGQGDTGIQPAYEPLEAHRPAHDVGPAGTFAVEPVVILGAGIEAPALSEVRAREAADIAQTIARVRDEAWPIGPDARPARLADVCILIPTRTSLPSLERALDRVGLPYRVESSSLVYASAEVRDLLNVLRAVDDPTAEVAVVAALRSPWFGCGDDDLLEHHAAGGAWDYRRAAPEGLGPDHPVVAGLEALHELHRQRWWHDASALIERVLEARRAFELGLDERRPRDVWRRLAFVADQARAFTDAYGSDLRRYLAWADLQRADDARVVEAVLPESDDDAVRIMTVHASKGLEFPVVVLAGLNTEYRAPGAGVDVLWGPAGPEVKVVKDITTAGYADLAAREQQIDRHEQLRLLYVAATRARDHLIVSLHHKVASRPRCHGATLEALAPATAERWRRLDPPAPTPGRRGTSSSSASSASSGSSAAGGAEALDVGVAVGTGIDPAGSLEARARWMRRRQAALDAAGQPANLAATSVARLARQHAARAEEMPGASAADPPAGDDAEPSTTVAEATPWRRGRAGTAIGRAVHGVLQRVELATGAGIEELARSQAGAEGVPERAGEVERLARAALAADVVAEAVAAPRFWREVYVGAPVADRTLEGFVDLLIEGPDGLTVVDYKTDAVRTDDDLDTARDTYRLQGASYAVALEQALGRPVVRCVFLFLRAGRAVEREVVDLDRAKAQVRSLLTEV